MSAQALSGKSNWRSQLRERAYSWNRKGESDLIANLVQFLLPQEGYWAGYMPHQFEPNIKNLFDSKKIKWVFPQLLGDKLIWLRPGLNGFSQGAFGIEEPSPDGAIRIATDDLTGALIPGIGFDRKGTRIGRGKGYYDRTFLSAKPSILKVGIAWSCQVVDELPAENHDMKVDFIITESEILDLRRG